ncbi:MULTISPECIES: porin [unclassified Bordetella]|uniref:porin n=1 Tax=unclassified Bordetella TaxID=2630031 RepID=UPI00132132C1|nr:MULTISPECIES: porin [unclassified Bordetella]MVW73565.1 porin [Bordetella sp. 15P40C-2]MVW77498.1 porin [Bordetella sp. 02P26C-1]
MKLTKTLLAGAILAGMSGTALAETQVTLYGLIDTGLTYQRGKVGTDDQNRGEYGGDYHSRFGMTDGIQSGSRWGLRGTEDLGDGVQAVFVLEGGFNSSNGRRKQGDRLFGRQATVGLQSDAWGRLDLGRQTNIASKYFADIDPFSLSYLNASMGSAFSAANTVRYDNMVMYQTPSYSGFQFGIGYSFNVDDVSRPGGFKTNDNSRGVTTGLRYNNGPLAVVVSYDQQFLKPNQPQPKQAIIGAAYDFEVVKLSLAYGWGKDGVLSGQEDFGFYGGGVNTNTPARGQGDTIDAFTWKGLKINSYLVGVSAPVGGASNVFASWQRADPNKGLEAMDIYSVGYTYDLSKRTNLYTFASYADAAGFVDGNKMTTVGVGLRHRF